MCLNFFKRRSVWESLVVGLILTVIGAGIFAWLVGLALNRQQNINYEKELENRLNSLDFFNYRVACLISQTMETFSGVPMFNFDIQTYKENLGFLRKKYSENLEQAVGANVVNMSACNNLIAKQPIDLVDQEQIRNNLKSLSKKIMVGFQTYNKSLIGLKCLTKE